MVRKLRLGGVPEALMVAPGRLLVYTGTGWGGAKGSYRKRRTLGRMRAPARAAVHAGTGGWCRLAARQRAMCGTPQERKTGKPPAGAFVFGGPEGPFLFGQGAVRGALEGVAAA